MTESLPKKKRSTNSPGSPAALVTYCTPRGLPRFAVAVSIKLNCDGTAPGQPQQYVKGYLQLTSLYRTATAAANTPTVPRR
jgi:hypothetical protein